MTQDRDELAQYTRRMLPFRLTDLAEIMRQCDFDEDHEGASIVDAAAAELRELRSLLAQQQAYELRITALEAGSAPVDWQLPYRTVDAAGSPESASSVAWAWINELAKGSPDGTGYIESTQLGSDNGAIILYYGTKPYAVATVFRDVMNFAVLVRWKSPEPRALLADAPRG